MECCFKTSSGTTVSFKLDSAKASGSTTNSDFASAHSTYTGLIGLVKLTETAAQNFILNFENNFFG